MSISNTVWFVWRLFYVHVGGAIQLRLVSLFTSTSSLLTNSVPRWNVFKHVNWYSTGVSLLLFIIFMPFFPEFLSLESLLFNLVISSLLIKSLEHSGSLSSVVMSQCRGARKSMPWLLPVWAWRRWQASSSARETIQWEVTAELCFAVTIWKLTFTQRAFDLNWILVTFTRTQAVLGLISV